MKKKDILKWSPAYPRRKPDCLTTSEAAEADLTGFVPTYEKEPHNMTYCMSNQYFRMWLKEREAYNLEMYSKKPPEEFRRGCVQRMMKPKITTVRVERSITLKQFSKVGPEVCIQK